MVADSIDYTDPGTDNWASFKAWCFLPASVFLWTDIGEYNARIYRRVIFARSKVNWFSEGKIHMEIDTRQLDFIYSILPLVMRCLGVVVFLPVSYSVRFSIVVLLTCVSYEDAGPVSGIWLYLQFLIGAAIGAALLFIKEGALILGSVLDAGRGQTLGMMLNPVDSELSSPLGGALSETIWYFCVVKGVIPLTVIAYLHSFDIFPLKGNTDISSKVIGSSVLQTATAVFVQISPILLASAAVIMLVDFVFLMTSALWKLDGLTPEHNLLRSLLVFFGFSILLYCNGCDLVSDLLKAVLILK